MATPQIRVLPDPLHQLLQRRARLHRGSLSQQALSDLQQACGGDPRERRRQAFADLLALANEQRRRPARTVPAEIANLVLDASAVVRIVEGSDQSALFQEALLNADLMLAPELMLTEVANALWRLQRADQLPADGLQPLLSRAAELVDVIEPDRHLQEEALALAFHLEHPLYACLNLALTKREGAGLLTSDQRLKQLAARVLP